MKKFIALCATLMLIFAFSVTCFAAPSPTKQVIDADETTAPNGNGTGGNGTGGSGNTSNVSPKTGAQGTLFFVAVISAAGVALISKKKYSEAK